MTLVTTPYLCATCGWKYDFKAPPEEKPLRRMILHCQGKKCKGKRRVFRPMYRPLSGDWK